MENKNNSEKDNKPNKFLSFEFHDRINAEFDDEEKQLEENDENNNQN
jgi:hypothetical protein